MTMSVNDHKVLRALFTNFFSVNEEGMSIPLDRIDQCSEPCGLDMRTLIGCLGGLQRKKLVVVVGSGVQSVIEWTRKGVRKAEALGMYYDAVRE